MGGYTLKMSTNVFVNDKLTNMLLSEFTTQEQRLFVESFQMYLTHGTDDSLYVVDLDDIWEWLGFSRRENAMRLFLKKFEKNVDYSDESLNYGKKQQHKILMNVSTFKDFCMLAETERGKQIRKYYTKMEQILFKFIEEENKSRIKEIEYQTAKKIEIDRHNVFKTAYKKRNVVYFIRMLSFDDGSFVLKIGQSDDVYDRLSKIKNEYKCDDLIVMDIFECESNREFETFLHNHPKIRCYKYNKVINTKVSTEAFLIPNIDVYRDIYTFAENNVLVYKDKTKEKKLLAIRMMELQNYSKVIEIYQDDPEMLYDVLKLMKIPEQKEEIVENINYIEEIESNTTIESKARPSGNIVQVYDARDTMKLLYVFNGIIEATRVLEGATHSQIVKASKEKFSYLGFRWNLVEKDDPQASIAKDIGPSSDRNTQSGIIAKIDDNSEIVEVYEDLNKAAKVHGIKAKDIMNSFMTGQKISEYNWLFWNFIPEEQRKTYMQNNSFTISEKNHGKGVPVEQIDPITMKVVATFSSITSVQKKFGMSPRDIKNYCVNGQISKNGYIWRFAKSVESNSD